MNHILQTILWDKGRGKDVTLVGETQEEMEGVGVGVGVGGEGGGGGGGGGGFPVVSMRPHCV